MCLDVDLLCAIGSNTALNLSRRVHHSLSRSVGISEASRTVSKILALVFSPDRYKRILVQIRFAMSKLSNPGVSLSLNTYQSFSVQYNSHDKHYCMLGSWGNCQAPGLETAVYTTSDNLRLSSTNHPIFAIACLRSAAYCTANSRKFAFFSSMMSSINDFDCPKRNLGCR